MKEEFVKEVPLINLDESQADFEIIRSILKSQKELEIAHRNFDYAEDDLIDYYSYKIKSEQSKIGYLLKLAKNKNLVMNAVDAKEENKRIQLEEAENQI